METSHADALATAADRPPPPSAAQILASRATQSAAPQPRSGSVAAEADRPIAAQPAPAPIKPRVEPQPVPVIPSVRPATRPGAAAIPPARIQAVAGDAGIDLGYDRGHRMMDHSPPAVIPVMARPMDTQAPTMVPGISLKPARDMDKGTATATLGKIIADTKTWVADFPHEVHGELAHVLGVYRNLASRQQMRTNAAAYGQPVEDDPIAVAHHVPPPEAFKLLAVSLQAKLVMEIYDRAMNAAGLHLGPDDQAAVSSLKEGLRATMPADV